MAPAHRGNSVRARPRLPPWSRLPPNSRLRKSPCRYLIAFLSLVLESQIGYPDRVFRAIGHPVTWIGRLISCLDRRLNRATDSDRRRRLCGVARADR